MIKTGELERARDLVRCQTCFYWKYSSTLTSEWVKKFMSVRGEEYKEEENKQQGYCRYNREAEEVIEYHDSVCGKWMNKCGQNASEFLKCFYFGEK